MSKDIAAAPRDSKPRPIGAVLSDMIENMLLEQLGALPSDTERKQLLMDLRARGAISDEMTALVFYFFPNMRGA